MNTQRRHHTATLALAALLILPAGLRAADNTPTFSAVGSQPGAPSVVHVPGDETNIGTPAEIRSAEDRVAGSGAAAVDLNSSGAVGARLNTDSATDTIQATGFAARDQALSLAERGANEGRAIAGAIENSASRLESDARADVEKAMRKADQARDRLDQAIDQGRNATERRWDKARDQIAERYEEFSKSLEKARNTAVENGARLDAQASGSVTGSAHRGS